MSFLKRLDIAKENNQYEEMCNFRNGNSKDFEKAMNDYLDDGYKVESSSCNSRYYKAILVLKEDE